MDFYAFIVIEFQKKHGLIFIGRRTLLEYDLLNETIEELENYQKVIIS